VVVGIVGSGADHHRTAASPARYGGLPSWLPKATVTVGRIVHANPAHSVLDEEGRIHHPEVTALHPGGLPERLTAGSPVSLKLYAVLPTGSGSLSWAPVAGRPLVSWDFDVEID
jgi:hypothetical protein